MKPKDRAIRALRREFEAASDNLYRAKRSFDPTLIDMDGEYGGSGRTCRQIFDGYQKEFDDIKVALAWLEIQ